MEVATPRVKRDCFALCNLQNTALFLTGGTNNEQHLDTLNSVECYNIEKNEWVKAPSLNINRQMHSSCAIGNSVYVFCGIGYFKCSINSIEKLSNATSVSTSSRWQVIFPNRDHLSPRVWPATCAINSQKILLLGGEVQSSKSKSNDAVIFDVRTETTQKVDFQSPNIAPFSALSNQCTAYKPHKAIALVELNMKQQAFVKFNLQKKTLKIKNLTKDENSGKNSNDSCTCKQDFY